MLFRSATSNAPISSLHGMNIAPFEQSWSTIVRIESYSPDLGSLVMKSKEIRSKGLASGCTSIGNRGTFGLCGKFFRDWHVAHPLIYWVIIVFIFGHQKFRAMMAYVFPIPGCPAVFAS